MSNHAEIKLFSKLPPIEVEETHEGFSVSVISLPKFLWADSKDQIVHFLDDLIEKAQEAKASLSC